MAVYSARQSTYTTGDTVTAAHTNNEFNAILAAFHVSTGHTHDGTTAGDGGPLSTLYSNAISMGTGADTDIAVTFNANSNDGVITWMEDEDYFQFSDDILISSTEKIQFRDTALYVYSSTDGQLDVIADTKIQLTATTIGLSGAISGTGIADEDDMSSNSATKLATQQSIKAYVDSQVTAQDLDVTSDSGTIAIDLDSETLTVAGGTGLSSSATSNTVTLAIDSTVTTLTGSQTLTNKTLTSPVLNTGISGTAVADEDDMSSNSATKIATQQSIKAYVDSSVSGVSTSWVLEDDDGTEVTVASGKEVKFIGSGLTTNWTDTDNGTDGDPYDLTFTLDAAQTGITSLLATDIKIGEDDETKIDFETANEIHFYANNTEQVYLADNIFGPQSDSDVDLGTTGVRWKDAYVDSVTVTDNLTVGGDLTVNGTTTTVNSTTVTIDDPIFTLGGDSAPGSDDNKDRGIEFRYHNGTAAKIGFFGWDDSATAFTFIPDASNSSEVFSGTVGNAVFGNITGTLQTAAQTNITSVGALDGGSITSGFGTIDTGSSNITTTGLISGGSLDIDDVLINGTTIGHTDDTDLMTLSNGGLVVAGTLEATGNITGTLATAAQTNITSLGTLSTLTVDNVIINGTTIGHTDDTDLMTLASGGLTVAGTIEGTTITASTALVPDASGGADLGSTSLEWGDVYIADDKKIYLGSDQNFSIEYDEDGNDTTAVVAANGVSFAPHGSSSGNGTELRFQELAANGANYVGFKAPDSISSNEVWVLPNADGSADQVLKTDGSNALAWVDQAGGGTVDLVADGAITAGKPVILTTAGKAQQVGKTNTSVINASLGSAGVIANSTNPTNDIKHLSTVYDTNSDRFVTTYADDGNSGYGTAVVHKITNATTGAMSFGTPVVFESADSDPGSMCQRPSCFDPDANRVVIAYKDGGDSNKGKAIVGSVNSGTESISFGTAVEFESGHTQAMSVVYDTNVDRVLIAYTDAGDSDKGKAIVGTVTAGTNAISFGAIAEFETNTVSHKTLAFDPDTNKILIVYDCRTSPSTGSSKVATITGGTDNTVAFGSKDTWDSGGDASEVAVVYDESVNKFLITWRDEGDSGKFKMIVGTISGTDMTYGTEVEVSQDSPYYINTNLTYYPTVNASVAIYASSSSTVSGNVITISGTTPANTTSIGTLASGTGINQSNPGAAYDPDLDRLVFTFENEDSDFRAGMITAEYGTNLTTSNFLGVAAASISDTATGKITINGGINENQSSLTIGTNYFATDAGLVATSGTQLIGKAVAADKIQVGVKSGTVAHNTVALDANAKLPAVDGSQLTGVNVVSFTADGAITAGNTVGLNTNDGKVKATFAAGTSSQLQAEMTAYGDGNQYSECMCRIGDTGKIVSFYRDNSDGDNRDLYYRVMTVASNGTVTLGTEGKIFDSSGGYQGRTAAVYLPDIDRIFFKFNDDDDSNKQKYCIGTLSGTTITWTTAALLLDKNTFQGEIFTLLDDIGQTNKISYTAIGSGGGDLGSGTDSYGVANTVFTVRGGTDNDIASLPSNSDGAWNNIISGNGGEVYQAQIGVDPENNKLIFAFADYDNSNNMKVMSWTYNASGYMATSGSTITLESAQCSLGGEQAESMHTRPIPYDSENTKLFCVAYRNASNADFKCAGVSLASTNPAETVGVAVINDNADDQTTCGIGYNATAQKFFAVYENGDISTYLYSNEISFDGNSFAKSSDTALLGAAVGDNTVHVINTTTSMPSGNATPVIYKNAAAGVGKVSVII
jgi:hypothetical protein